MLSGFCVNGQHWLHCKAQVTHHALDPASLQTLPMLLHTVLPLRYFCIDLLPSCVCFQGVSSQHRHACARRLSSLLATDPVRVREHGQLFSQLPIFKHLSPVSLTFLVPGKPFSAWQGSADWGLDIFRHNSFTMSVMSVRSWQPVTSTCDAELDSMALTLPLLSHQVLLVSARSCSWPVHFAVSEFFSVRIFGTDTPSDPGQSAGQTLTSRPPW